MSGAAAGATAGTGAAAAAAIANAIKASGAIVKVEPENFESLLERASESVVIYSEGGFIRTHYDYMLSYKGFIFYTRSSSPLFIPESREVIESEKIWIPV